MLLDKPSVIQFDPESDSELCFLQIKCFSMPTVFKALTVCMNRISLKESWTSQEDVCDVD